MDCATASEEALARDRDLVMRRPGVFQRDMTTDLTEPRLQSPPQQIGQTVAGKHREEFSCHQQDFVTDQVQANSFRPGTIKIECRVGLQNTPAQLVPRVACGEDALREAFGAVSAIWILDHFEHRFRHASMRRPEFVRTWARPHTGAATGESGSEGPAIPLWRQN